MGVQKKIKRKAGKSLRILGQYKMPYHGNHRCPNGEDQKNKKVAVGCGGGHEKIFEELNVENLF